MRSSTPKTPSTEPKARNSPPESETASEPTAGWRERKLRAFPATRRYSAQMPEISRFFGIVVTMYYNDHDPPHFHVRYGEKRAIIAIESLKVLDGALPTREMAICRTGLPRLLSANRESGTLSQ